MLLGQPLSVEGAPDGPEAVDEGVHVVLVVVERQTGAAAGEVLDAEPGEQRLGAVVAGADADPLHIEDARDVVRVDSIDVEADDAMVAVPVDRSDDRNVW